MTAIKGRVFDIAVDLRKNSKTYGKYFSCILSEKNSNSIYIPPGFAHGFQALDKEIISFIIVQNIEIVKVKLQLNMMIKI